MRLLTVGLLTVLLLLPILGPAVRLLRGLIRLLSYPGAAACTAAGAAVPIPGCCSCLPLLVRRGTGLGVGGQGWGLSRDGLMVPVTGDAHRTCHRPCRSAPRA